MNILVAVPPKILGSSTKQNLHREGNVENAGRREEKKERTTVWKRKKTEKKTTKKLRRKVFNSLRHLRSTKDVLFSDSLLFLIVETFETVVFPGQLVAS